MFAYTDYVFVFVESKPEQNIFGGVIVGVLLTLLLYAWPKINSLESENRSLKHKLEGEKGAKNQALKIIIALSRMPETFELNNLSGVDDHANKLVSWIMSDLNSLDRNETIRKVAEWHNK